MPSATDQKGANPPYAARRRDRPAEAGRGRKQPAPWASAAAARPTPWAAGMRRHFPGGERLGTDRVGRHLDRPGLLAPSQKKQDATVKPSARTAALAEGDMAKGAGAARTPSAEAGAERRRASGSSRRRLAGPTGGTGRSLGSERLSTGTLDHWARISRWRILPDAGQPDYAQAEQRRFIPRPASRRRQSRGDRATK